MGEACKLNEKISFFFPVYCATCGIPIATRTQKNTNIWWPQRSWWLTFITTGQE